VCVKRGLWWFPLVPSKNHHTTAPLCSLLEREEREGGGNEWMRKREERRKEKEREQLGNKAERKHQKPECYFILRTLVVRDLVVFLLLI